MKAWGNLHRLIAAALMVALAAAAVLGEGREASRVVAGSVPPAGASRGGLTGAGAPVALSPSEGPAAKSPARVLFSADRRYAFPLAGDVAEMAWTHYHWDGGNAVDILARPGLQASSPAFRSFERSSVVAVTAGIVSRADNDLGGTALVLRGTDRREYYYAHLSQTWVTTPVRVSAGEILGTVGRTGLWAQYLERHLHFAITSRWHRGLDWKNDINAAEWIRAEFGLGWIDQTPKPYPAAYPHGSPLRAPFRVIQTFDQMRARDPDIASIELLAAGPVAQVASAAGDRGAAAGQAGVYSTLTGEIRLLRGTVLGLRVQVTNRHTNQTVVFSGLARSLVQTGDVVRRGGLVGYAEGEIDYMYFDDGALADPLPTMGGRP